MMITLDTFNKREETMYWFRSERPLYYESLLRSQYGI